MNEELLRAIEDLGLSEKEAKVYVANLMLGPSTVQRIADQANIKRVTTYVILESLAGLGLVSQSNQGKKTYFTAEDPISLRRLLKKKEQQITDQKASFENILPELQTLKNLPAESPSVKFYDTAEGIRSIFASFFSIHKDKLDIVYGISNLDQLHSFFPEISLNFTNPERVKQNIKSRFIYTTKQGPIYEAGDKEALRESKFLPLDKFPFSGDISISSEYVVLITFHGTSPIGIVIQSKELAESMIVIFGLLWNSSDANLAKL